MVLALLNQSEDLDIQDVTGSLRSGFSAGQVKVKLDKERFSILEEVGFSYNYKELVRSNRLIINRIHVQRAHLYLPNPTEDEEEEKEEEEVETDDSDTPGETNEGNELDGFEIHQIDINHVRIEVADSDFLLDVDAVHLDGLLANEGSVLMGPLTIKSTFFNLETQPLDPEGQPSDAPTSGARIQGILKTGVHSNVVNDVDFKGSFTLGENGKSTLSLFEGKWIYTSNTREGKSKTTIAELTMDDYVKGLFPGRNLSIAVEGQSRDGEETFVLKEGEFELGQRLFTFSEQSMQDQDEVLTATSRVDDLPYTLRIRPPGEGFRCLLTLETEPAMPMDQQVSLLYFGKTPEGLSTEEKQQLDQLQARFKRP
jgi:hypothetical protein